MHARARLRADGKSERGVALFQLNGRSSIEKLPGVAPHLQKHLKVERSQNQKQINFPSVVQTEVYVSEDLLLDPMRESLKGDSPLPKKKAFNVYNQA